MTEPVTEVKIVEGESVTCQASGAALYLYLRRGTEGRDDIFCDVTVRLFITEDEANFDVSLKPAITQKEILALAPPSPDGLETINAETLARILMKNTTLGMYIDRADVQEEVDLFRLELTLPEERILTGYCSPEDCERFLTYAL